MPRYKKSKPINTRKHVATFKREVEKKFEGKQVVMAAEGEVKMSDVLEAFISPYLYLATTTETYHKLLVVAITAWNIALRPAAERDAELARLLALMPQMTAQEKDDMKAIVGALIVRKERFFAKYQRTILDYQLKDLGDKYHLSVVSSLEPAA